mmetsp:Transcript_14229/g.21896  ORF Transcript_14229/g.21896 Transcript_14229/m.21896 type:complete len:503 (+) Transcript_14229:105-1613(+)
MSQQGSFKRRLQALMNQKENQTCCDCPEKQPRWASLIVPPPDLAPKGSIPIGAFMCLECSGSHRRLGVHIAFVRSVNLDQWKEREVLAMENGGNAKVNAIFEARLPNLGNKIQAGADGRTRERYIRDKYERRKYYDPRVAASLQSKEEGEESSSGEEEEEESEEETPPQPSVRSARSSDVARRRAQARKENPQNKPTILKPVPRAPKAVAKPKVKPATAAVTVVVEPEVDLLDFGSFPSEPVKNATPLAPPSQPTSPQGVNKQLHLQADGSASIADLFGGMNMSAPRATATATATVPQKQPEEESSSWTASFVQAPSASGGAAAAATNTGTTVTPRKSNADIMAMFQTAQQQQQPMQQMMMMMPPSSQQQVMMQQGYGGGMTIGNMQPQTRQPQMMMNYGNISSGGMQQQQHQQMTNNINMMYAAQQQQQQMAMMNQFQMGGGGMMQPMSSSPAGFDQQMKQQEQMMAMMQANRQVQQQQQQQQQQQNQFSAFNQFNMNGMG